MILVSPIVSAELSFSSRLYFYLLWPATICQNYYWRRQAGDGNLGRYIDVNITIRKVYRMFLLRITAECLIRNV